MATALISEQQFERTMNIPDVPLLHRVATGDSAAIDDCIATYGTLVWALARKFCKPQDAEDSAQDIFIAIWQSAGQFDPEIASEKTFITMIARRKLIDRMRRSSSNVEMAAVDHLVEIVEGDTELDPVELAEEAGKARSCLKKLSEAPRQVILLSVYQGLSHSKISEKLHLPLGTIKSYARRSLLQLRDCMKRPLSSSAGGEA